MCSDVVIRCEGLGKAYRRYGSPADWLKERLLRKRRGQDFWALRDVNFEVRRGETLGIVGRNGAGKSTLLQLICGTLQATRGNVDVRGRVAALLELGAGFDPDFTGRENVELSAAVLGLSRREITARLPKIEGFAGIGEFIDHPVRHYSSGMFARLAFAVCAHVDADILVIDEILGVGDAAFRQKCMQFLHQFRARGTLLFVSHDEGAVLALCERALWLEEGLQRDLGPSREVCTRYLAGLGPRSSSGFASGGAARPPSSPDVRWVGKNPIQISEFDVNGPSHGYGGAVIEQAGLFSPAGAKLSRAHGGEEVELRVTCRAERPLRQAIVGFILRNHQGVHLLGDNTYATYREAPPAVDPGERFTGIFRFQLPLLRVGQYSLTVAITEGSRGHQVHLHWIEQALMLRAETSPFRRGEIKIPMSKVALQTMDHNA